MATRSVKTSIQAGKYFGVQRRKRLGIDFAVDGLDDASNRQNSVKCWRLSVSIIPAISRIAATTSDDDIAIDLDTNCGLVADNSQRGLHVAARQSPGTALAHMWVEPFEPGGQARSDIETLAVDATDFPGPTIANGRTIGTGESGHAAAAS